MIAVLIACAAICALAAVVCVASALVVRADRRAVSRFADNAKIAEGLATVAASRAARTAHPRRMPHQAGLPPMVARAVGVGEQR